MHVILDTVQYLQHSGTPGILLRLDDDENTTVDLSVGYDTFRAQLARENKPTVAVVPAITGTTGLATGFLIPTVTLDGLDYRFTYLLTATARHIASGQPRRAQCRLEVLPAPAP